MTEEYDPVLAEDDPDEDQGSQRDVDTIEDLQGGATSEGVIYGEILTDYQTMDVARREANSGNLSDSTLRSALVQLFNDMQLPAQYFNAFEHVLEIREGPSVPDNKLRKRNARVSDDMAMIVNGGFGELDPLVLPLPAQIFFALDRYAGLFSREVQFSGYYELVRTKIPATQLRAETEVLQYDWGRLMREFSPPENLDAISRMFDLHSKYGVRELMSDLQAGVNAPFIKTIIKEIMFEMRLAITATNEKSFAKNIFNSVLISKGIIKKSEYQKVLIYPKELLESVKQRMRENFETKLKENAKRRAAAERAAQKEEKETGLIVRSGKEQAAQVIKKIGGTSAAAASSSRASSSSLVTDDFDSDDDDDDDDFTAADEEDYDSEEEGKEDEMAEESTKTDNTDVNMRFHSLFEDEKSLSNFAKNYYRRLRQYIDIVNYNVLGGMYELAYQDAKFADNTQYDPVLLSALYPAFKMRTGGARTGVMESVSDMIFKDISNGIIDAIRYHIKNIANKFFIGISAGYKDKTTTAQRSREQFSKEIDEANKKFHNAVNEFLQQMLQGFIGKGFSSTVRESADKYHRKWMTEADEKNFEENVLGDIPRYMTLRDIRKVGKINDKVVYREVSYDPESPHDFVKKSVGTGIPPSHVVLSEGENEIEAGRSANFVGFIREGYIPEHTENATLWEESEAMYFAVLIYTSLMGVKTAKGSGESEQDWYYERLFKLKAYADTAVASAITINQSLDMTSNAYLWYSPNNRSKRMPTNLSKAIKLFVETGQPYSFAIMDKQTQRKIAARDDANIVAINKYLEKQSRGNDKNGVPINFFRFVNLSSNPQVFDEKSVDSFLKITDMVHMTMRALFSVFDTTKTSTVSVDGVAKTFEMLVERDMSGRKELTRAGDIKVTMPELINIVMLVATTKSKVKLSPKSELNRTPPVVVAAILCEIMKMVRKEPMHKPSYHSAISNIYSTFVRAGFYPGNFYFTTLVKTIPVVAQSVYSSKSIAQDTYTGQLYRYFTKMAQFDMDDEYHSVHSNQKELYLAYTHSVFKHFAEIVAETREQVKKQAAEAAKKEAEREQARKKAEELRQKQLEEKTASEEAARNERLEKTRLQTQIARLAGKEADEEESANLAEIARRETEQKGEKEDAKRGEKRQRTEGVFTQALIAGRFNIALNVVSRNPDDFEPEEHELIMCHMKSLVSGSFDVLHAFKAARNSKYKHGISLLASYLASDAFKPEHLTKLRQVKISAKKGDEIVLWTTLLGAAVAGENWPAVKLLVKAGSDPRYPLSNTPQGTRKLEDGRVASNAENVAKILEVSDKLSEYLAGVKTSDAKKSAKADKRA